MKKHKEVLDKVLIKHGIEFTDSLAQDMFYSHMNALWDRLENKTLLEDIPEMYEEILKEIDSKSMGISEEIVLLFLDEYKLDYNMMEIVLVATHIQMQLEREDALNG